MSCRIVALVCGLCLTPVYAGAQPYAVTIGDVPPTLAVTGGIGLTHMRTAEITRDGTWLTSLSRDNSERWPGKVDHSKFLLSGSVGVASDFELFGAVALLERLDVDAPRSSDLLAQPPPVWNAAHPYFTQGVGEIGGGGKWLLNRIGGTQVSVAVSSGIALGHTSEVLGRPRARAVAELLASRPIGNRVALHGLVGVAVAALRRKETRRVSFETAFGAEVLAAGPVTLQGDLCIRFRSDFPEGSGVATDVTLGPAVVLTRRLTARGTLVLSHGSARLENKIGRESVDYVIALQIR